MRLKIRSFLRCFQRRSIGQGKKKKKTVCRARRPPALILHRHCLGTQAEREAAERAAQLRRPGICFPISHLPTSTKARLCTCGPQSSFYWFPAFPFSSSKACKWLRAERERLATVGFIRPLVADCPRISRVNKNPGGEVKSREEPPGPCPGTFNFHA